MTDLTFSYFPGCSAESTGSSFTQSMNYVAEKIGMKLEEIDDWCCCGTSAARITNDDLKHALPTRSLALSEQQHPGMPVIASCAACYSVLKEAQVYAAESEENLAHVNSLIDMDYHASIDVTNILEVLVQPDVQEKVVAALKTKLNGAKLACYYGCLLVRPTEVVQFDNPENPTKMEGLLNACGAECVDWSFKTECCGASNHIVSPKAARKAVERIFRNAKANGADAIVTACPLCWLNLDMREDQVNSEMGTDYHLPVYYFTELIAMAMGATADEAGLKKHFEPAEAYAASLFKQPEAEEVAK